MLCNLFYLIIIIMTIINTYKTLNLFFNLHFLYMKLLLII